MPLCRFWNGSPGSCMWGSACQFQHEVRCDQHEPEISEGAAAIDMAPCPYWDGTPGSCAWGASYRFLHGDAMESVMWYDDDKVLRAAAEHNLLDQLRGVRGRERKRGREEERYRYHTVPILHSDCTLTGVCGGLLWRAITAPSHCTRSACRATAHQYTLHVGWLKEKTKGPGLIR